MNNKQILGFITTAEQGSFSKAAQVLFVTPQALVQQINALENEIGIPLFTRSPQGVRCTPAGQLFYKNVKYLNNFMDQVIEECRQLDNQKKEMLRVGAFAMPIFMPIICFSFSNKYPLIETKQVEMNSKDFYKLLLLNEVDVVESGSFSLLNDTGLLYTKVMEYQLVCILTADHPLARKARIEMGDLVGLSVGVPECFFTLNEKYNDIIDKINFVEGVYSREVVASICTSGGTFIAMQPSADSLRPLVSVPLDYELQEVGLLTRADLSPAVSLFIDEAIKAFNIFR